MYVCAGRCSVLERDLVGAGQYRNPKYPPTHQHNNTYKVSAVHTLIRATRQPPWDTTLWDTRRVMSICPNQRERENRRQLLVRSLSLTTHSHSLAPS